MSRRAECLLPLKDRGKCAGLQSDECELSSANQKILTPDLWTYSSVCHAYSTEIIQSCSHFGALNLSYTSISVSPGSHLHSSRVKHMRVKCLAQRYTIETCLNIEKGETWYFSENPAPIRARNRAAGSDIGKAARSIAPCLSLTNNSKFLLREVWFVSVWQFMCARMEINILRILISIFAHINCQTPIHPVSYKSSVICNCQGEWLFSYLFTLNFYEDKTTLVLNKLCGYFVYFVQKIFM